MPSPTISRTAEPPEDWRAFAAANGTFYHRPEWALCLGEMYGLRLDYYSAREQGELCGLLAVAEIPPLFGPRRYVSLPFSYAAGPLAPDPGVAALLSAAADYARTNRRKSLGQPTSRGKSPDATDLGSEAEIKVHCARSRHGSHGLDHDRGHSDDGALFFSGRRRALSQ